MNTRVSSSNTVLEGSLTNDVGSGMGFLSLFSVDSSSLAHNTLEDSKKSNKKAGVVIILLDISGIPLKYIKSVATTLLFF